eukprot:14109028-Heterocapsa_arctica.AAC.1
MQLLRRASLLQRLLAVPGVAGPGGSGKKDGRSVPGLRLCSVAEEHRPERRTTWRCGAWRFGEEGVG